MLPCRSGLASNSYSKGINRWSLRPKFWANCCLSFVLITRTQRVIAEQILSMKFLARSSPPVLALLAALAIRTAAQAAPAGDALPTDAGPAYGARLEGFAYPWPVR